MSKPKSSKLSKNLKQLRAIALTITKEHRISVNYSEEAQTAYIDLDSLNIVLSSKLIPKRIHKYPLMFQRCLDAEVSHEAGHYCITRPLQTRYDRFINAQKYIGLAKTVYNIIEDKRVNYFIEKRYRFDLGKRLKWFKDILCKAGTTAIESMVKDNPLTLESPCSQPAIMLNLIIHVGLYEGKINKTLWNKLTKTQQKEVKHVLKLLDKAQFTWVKHDLIKMAEEFYQIIEKNVTDECIDYLKNLIPESIEGGGLGLDLSEKQEKSVASEERAEREAQKQKEDLKQGGGAGISKGEFIPSPKANFKAYFEFVTRNKPEIDRLLNKLKEYVKPILKRQLFRKHGRIMSPLLNKAYVSSHRRIVNRIYQKSEISFEKEKVALGFIIDFSGSMNYNVACDVVTQMNEVFGQWLDDESYSIIVFGADYQKIKTFFESFSNTRARIGGISVNAGGTMLANPTEDMRKMFHSITEDKTKILVLCSDFWLGDDYETQETVRRMLNEGIKVLLIGLCSGIGKVESFLPNERNIFRTYCENPKDLPEFFLSVYLKSIGNIRK